MKAIPLEIHQSERSTPTLGETVFHQQRIGNGSISSVPRQDRTIDPILLPEILGTELLTSPFELMTLDLIEMSI
ncbi:MAG: hypothetical protein DCF28_11000 [Alphaproteobacteria bacterium]|nr:MAG: hypothetical protein DCF28_11000 [Alphaproteobacteria bacterium]PZO33928.1 MAG: hypothetical protein DCE92_12325 [Alphaproteobacteria bacterium]